MYKKKQCEEKKQFLLYNAKLMKGEHSYQIKCKLSGETMISRIHAIFIRQSFKGVLL
jgi:hypothetical protein